MPPYWICIELCYKDYSIFVHFQTCLVVVHIDISAIGKLLRCVADCAVLNLYFLTFVCAHVSFSFS